MNFYNRGLSSSYQPPITSKPQARLEVSRQIMDDNTS